MYSAFIRKKSTCAWNLKKFRDLLANHARSNPLLRFWEVYLTRWESNLVACLRNVCLIQTISNSSVIHDDPFNGEKIEFLCSFWKTSFARTISFNFYLNWDSFNIIFFFLDCRILPFWRTDSFSFGEKLKNLKKKIHVRS